MNSAQNKMEAAGPAVTSPPSGASGEQRREGDRAPSRPLMATAWIAALFCLLVCAAMLYQRSVAAQHDPWKSPQLLALKEKLVASPKDENLKQEIRRLDLQFRQRYFRRLSLNSTGAWLLIGGLAVFLATAAQAVRLRQQLPMPQPKPDAAGQTRRRSAQARWSVAVVGAVAAGGLAVIAVTAQPPLPESASELAKLLGRAAAPEAVADLPSLAEFRANWPRFRGPDGSGVSTQSSLPPTGDGKSDTGIAWQSAIPAPGFNSPVVWGNRVFISGGDANKREVFCYDAANGALLWRRAIENVPGSPPNVPAVPEDTGYAASTTATDGRRVYAVFANGDLAALTLEGAPVWSKFLGVPKNPYGYATSLAVWPGKVIVQFDQGESQPADSKLLAFDSASGRLLWERSRPVPSSWASPIIVEESGQTQILTLGMPWIIAYSLADGNELWRARLLDGEVAPSPVFAGGLVIAINPSTQLIAIRPGGAGDVTKSHVAWTATDNVPDISSPVSNGELVFTAGSGGMITCFDAKDGRKVWEHDLEMEVNSSPGIAGDRLFVLGAKGAAVVVEAGRQFRQISRTELADRFLASPAFANGRVFLRGTTNLWCLGAAPEKEAKAK